MKKNDHFQELTPDEKLRADNELLKLKLQTEFGMSEINLPLSDDMENQFLNNIYEFEKQYTLNKQIKLYDFIGKPEFKKAEMLTSKEISSELERLQDIMASHNVNLGTICDYEDEVIYRFITEELFEQEIDDIRIPTMTLCFTYEEIHPNHDYDIRSHSHGFIKALITRKWNAFIDETALCKKVSYNGKLFTKENFSKIIEEFQSEHPKMTHLKWKGNSVKFDLKKKTASLEGTIKYKSVRTGKIFEGEVFLTLKLEWDYWSISKVVLPGFSK